MEDRQLCRTIQCWRDMKQRCYNPRAQQYKNYGARGIAACDCWLDSFPNFLSDMGLKPDGLTLERKNTNGDYTPENCTWANRMEQRNNQRNSVLIEHGGRRMSIYQWAREYGVNSRTLTSRIKAGYPFEKALERKRFSRHDRLFKAGLTGSASEVLAAMNQTAPRMCAMWVLCRRCG